MNLSLAFSPCPNDCFIFDALVHKRIDTQGLDFTVHLEDVESLNRWAQQEIMDITKLSFHAYAYVMNKYVLLRSGSALGYNCGPILVSKNQIKHVTAEVDKVAIPGKLTTANFLLSLAFPEITNKVEYLFSDIEQAVLDEQVDAGLIIHENRFTYHQKGLKKLIDLGEYWESHIHAPIPLGGIVMKRSFDKKTLKTVNDLIRKSVEYAFAHPEASMPYVRANAQEMSEEVMKKHIDLYVNEFTIDLGKKGEEAVQLLFDKAKEVKLFESTGETLIIS